MASNMMIDTGEPRNVTGHVVSGALAAGAVAGAMNYNAYKKGEMSKEKAISDSMKLSVQGGIATGSAVAAANYLGQGNIMGMLTAISVGAMGVYGVQVASEKLEENIKNKRLEAMETCTEIEEKEEEK
jgi:hypothetical protein